MMRRLGVLLLVLLAATVHAIISFVAGFVAYVTNGQPYSRVWYWIAAVLLIPVDLTNLRFFKNDPLVGIAQQFLNNHELVGIALNSLIWAVAIASFAMIVWRRSAPKTRGFLIESSTECPAADSD